MTETKQKRTIKPSIPTGFTVKRNYNHSLSREDKITKFSFREGDRYTVDGDDELGDPSQSRVSIDFWKYLKSINVA